MHSVDYEMRCRNCGEGKQFVQRSYYYNPSEYTSNKQLNSEYQQAEQLAMALRESNIICDWCNVALWDVYSVKINGNSLMDFANDLFYYAVLLDKNVEGDISFEEQGDSTLPWRTCYDALHRLYSVVGSTEENRFGNNQLDFGGDAELIVSFKKDASENYILNRVEKICFIGFDKNELMDAVAYTNNNLYGPALPRISL